MFTSVLLRLRADRLALGELVGECELVETGLRVVFRDAGELLDQLRASAPGPARPRDATAEPEPTG